MTAWELREHEIWWKGPPWLWQDPIAVPNQPQHSDVDKLQDEEVKASVCAAVTSAPTLGLEHRYGSYRTLLHVTAWVLIAAHNFLSPIRHHSVDRSGCLVVANVKAAEVFLLKNSQLRSFPAEVKLLSATPPQPLSNSNKLLCFNPFMGTDGLLHIGGRLSKAPMPDHQRHPVIISSHDIFTSLLFKFYHVVLSHCGPTLLLAHAGENYHVVGARQLARKICKQYVPCRKVAAKAQSQLMGQLPAARVTPDHVFATTGVDYAGPFLLKRVYTRKPQIVKAYLAVFVCFATKAVHLEVVSDMTTEAFLATLRRFVSRRGCPHGIHSDNGSNFVGAKNDLQELTRLLMSASTSAAVHSYLLGCKIEWHCIPERAPHFGGLWEAAVKSAKLHLRRVVGEQKLDFEEMTTVAAQVEACLNSRPLGFLYSHSPDAVAPLTPGHFLVGRPLQAYPELAIDCNMSLCRR